jgi:hypothetical protein
VVTGARTPTSTSWSTAVCAIPCLRAAGGDWNKQFNIDYMVDWSKERRLCKRTCFPLRDFDINTNFRVDYRPRDSLFEGRGW